MKHLLAAATAAALLAGTPAGAQTVFGSVVTDNDGASVGAFSVGGWKNNFAIYGSVNPPAEANKPAGILTYAEDGPDVYYGNLQADLGTASFAASGALLSSGGPAIDATTGVPEPSTWAMMLFGFGAIGGALRSNRKAALRFA